MIGWGAQVQGGGLAETLVTATVTTVSNDECRNVMGAGRISDNMICAGRPGVDTCQVCDTRVLFTHYTCIIHIIVCRVTVEDP